MLIGVVLIQLIGATTVTIASSSAPIPVDPCTWFGILNVGVPSHCDPIALVCTNMIWSDSTLSSARFAAHGPGLSVTCDQARAALDLHYGLADVEPQSKRPRRESSSSARRSNTSPTPRSDMDASDEESDAPTTTTVRPRRGRRIAVVSSTTTTSTTTTTTTTTEAPTTIVLAEDAPVTLSAHLTVVDAFICDHLIPIVEAYPHILLGQSHLASMRGFLDLVSLDGVVSHLIPDPITTTTTTSTPYVDEEDYEGNPFLGLNMDFSPAATEIDYDERFTNYFYQKLNELESFNALLDFINIHMLEYVSVASPGNHRPLEHAAQWFHLLRDLSDEAIDEEHSVPHDWRGDVDRYFQPYTVTRFPRMYVLDQEPVSDPPAPILMTVSTSSAIDVDDVVGRLGQFVAQLNEVDMLLRDMDDFEAPYEYFMEIENLEWIFSSFFLPTQTVDELDDPVVPDSFATLIYLFRNEICGRIHRIGNFVQWAGNSDRHRPRNARVMSLIARNCQSISPMSRRINASQFTFALSQYTAIPFSFTSSRFVIRYPRFEAPREMVNRSCRELERSEINLLGEFVVLEHGNPDAGEIGIRRQWMTRMVYEIMYVGAARRWDLFEYTDDRHAWMRPKPINSNVTDEDRVVYLERFRLVGRILGIALKYEIVPGVRLAPSVIAMLRWGSSGEIFSSQNKTDYFLREEDPSFLHGLVELRNVEETARDMVFSSLDFAGLVPGGSEIEVNEANLEEYILFKKQQRLVREIAVPMANIVRGISDVIGRAGLDMLTAEELQSMITGPLNVTGEMVTRGLLFKNGILPSEFAPAQWLLELIGEMTERDRKQFLFFVTSSRMPPINAEDGAWLKVVFDAAAPVGKLPKAQTCFNEITLPHYKSKDQMRDRIMTAIANAGSIENS